VSLAAEEGIYSLLPLGPAGARAEVVSSLSAVHAGADLAALRSYFADPALAVVTSTVTEAGYQRNAAGGLDADAPAVAADIEALRDDPVAGVVTTTPGRLVAGLLARRAAGAGPIALVPNDNVPDNGEMVAHVVGDLARAVDTTLADWVGANVSFVTTMVDRITPRTTDADRAEVTRQLGVDDPEAVPTEPFAEWILAGDFPAGRPAWEVPGARFVDDVRPFEQRKLLLLNGSHSLMAYAASILGHETVADAIADPTVLRWVEEWWDAAAPTLTHPTEEVTAYRAALLERYRNPNIRHLLAQIAADGSQKVPIRAVPVLEAAIAAGNVTPGATRTVAAWVSHLRGHGAPVADARADEVRALVAGSVEEGVTAVLARLGVEDDSVVALVVAQVEELESRSAS
jgi:fructuronate reductase